MEDNYSRIIRHLRAYAVGLPNGATYPLKVELHQLADWLEKETSKQFETKFVDDGAQPTDSDTTTEATD